MFRRIKAFFGYVWAVSALLIILAVFIGNDFFAKNLVSATGLTVSPHFTGGEVVRTINHPGYRTTVHRPVFDGLITECSKGFLQVDWRRSTGDSFPDLIDEPIDYDRDGKADFRIKMNTRTGTAHLNSFNTSVIKIEKVYQLPEGFSVRIILHKIK